MYFLHAINSDRQTRLLTVFGQIAMILGDKVINYILLTCTRSSSAKFVQGHTNTAKWVKYLRE